VLGACRSDEAILFKRNITAGAGGGFTVGSSGGTINYVPPGAASIQVDLTLPANAVPDGTVITVEESDNSPSDPDVDMIPDLVFQFGPEGLVFAVPVLLKITYDPSELGGEAPEDMRVFRSTGGLWEALDATLDAAAHTLSANIPGFSFFGIGIPIDLTPPVTTADPFGGIFNDCVDVYLNCNDGDGVGCNVTFFDKIEGTGVAAYTLYDGGPITLTRDTTLMFYSTDLNWNSGEVSTEEYTVNGCGEDPPTNTTPANFINGGAESTTSLDLSLEISATDNTAVTAYLVKSDNADPPDPDDPDWVAVTPTTNYSDTVSYLHPNDIPGVKTVHVFFKNGSGLVSEVASDSITYSTGDCTLIDFETLPDGTPWGGGGNCGEQYAVKGVSFQFTMNGGGCIGACVPWVELSIPPYSMHWLTNAKRASPAGWHIGVLHMAFSGNPTEVAYRLWYPTAAGIMTIEADDATGQPVPESAIGRQDIESIGIRRNQNITISWASGISAIRLYASGFKVNVDDLSFCGGE